MAPLKSVLEEVHPETGETTGKLSTSRVLAWVFAVMAVAILVSEVVVSIVIKFMRESCEGSLFGLKASVLYAVGLGVVSVGFYMNRAGGVFEKIVDKLTS